MFKKQLLVILVIAALMVATQVEYVQGASTGIKRKEDIAAKKGE